MRSLSSLFCCCLDSFTVILRFIHVVSYINMVPFYCWVSPFFFFVVEYTWHKIYHFTYNSIALSMLHNYQYDLYLELLHYPQIFSSVLDNRQLIPSTVFFISDFIFLLLAVRFGSFYYPTCFSLSYTFFSLASRAYGYIIVILMYYSTNSSICVISGSVFIDCFFSLYGHLFWHFYFIYLWFIYLFIHFVIPSKFRLDTRCYEFYIIGC